MSGAPRRPATAVAAARALAVLVLCGAGLAGAADDADPSACRPDGNQQQMNACAVRDFRAADAALNIRYREVMAELPTAPRVALRKEQRDWLRRRDPACKTEARASEGGSIWPLVFHACLEKASRERTTELEAWKGRR
ncbi:lysozyme inhibitor LprI family protein [Comamonadaceae bacterium OTU4NAUVB1]|nr:lysozyme inhibitor LprI family protein [Comamonadaceae bacterium OTU4NAUVB1]